MKKTWNRERQEKSEKSTNGRDEGREEEELASEDEIEDEYGAHEAPPCYAIHACF